MVHWVVPARPTHALASAELANVGLCNIATDAPPAVELALDRVLAHGIGAQLDTVSERITALLPNLGAAPGAVVSVQGPGWHYVKAAGRADPDTGVPVDCQQPFQIRPPGTAPKPLRILDSAGNRQGQSGESPTSMRSHLPPGILAPRPLSLRQSCSWA